jgi:hypothetical protein
MTPEAIQLQHAGGVIESRPCHQIREGILPTFIKNAP